MKTKVALHTLGCKLNFSETSTIGKEFLTKGFEIVDFNNPADVYVFNTCTVTENAERECRQLIRRALRSNPQAYIIVTGCYAQLRPERIASIEGVDAVLGSNEKFQIFSLLDEFDKKELSCIYVSPTDELGNQFGFASSTDADSRTRAFLKIQDGCDYKCSFCTIPLARGLSRSMNPENVIKEFKTLIDSGYKEIILTGVNVGDYGKFYDTDLYQLLLRLVELDGRFRIRISSIEPNLLSDDIIKLTAQTEKLCNHFHIPLQSGSPSVLKAMQRRYSVEDYKDVIYRVKESLPDAGIGVDVIVGFPGETEDDFLSTYTFLNELPISYLHVFTYSERPDTKAVLLPGIIPPSERKRRNNMLRILSEKKRNSFYHEMIGKDIEVLFESENVAGKMKGFSSNYVRVVNSFNTEMINTFCKIEITGVNEILCYGNIKETKKSIALQTA